MKAQGTVTALLSSYFAASALGGEQGTINQANPLDITMRFYMHPAHLYLANEAPHAFGEHPAALVKRGETQGNTAQTPTVRPHPALVARPAPEPRMAQSQPAPIFP